MQAIITSKLSKFSPIDLQVLKKRVIHWQVLKWLDRAQKYMYSNYKSLGSLQFL